jgi:type I restriction enzyme S subunit
LPALVEQRRIAAILDKADAIRRKRRNILGESSRLIQSVFLETFGDPATNPMGFPVRLLSSAFSQEREGVKCGPFGSALKKHEHVTQGIPVWTVDNVGKNEFREEGCLFITLAKFQELKSYAVRNGDILISRAGTVGRMAIVQTSHPQSIIHSNLIRLSLDTDQCLPSYFVTLMTLFAARVGRLKTGQEGSYTFMNTGRLGELRLPLPPIEVQEKFVRTLGQIDLFRRRMRLDEIEEERLLASLSQLNFL